MYSFSNCDWARGITLDNFIYLPRRRLQDKSACHLQAILDSVPFTSL